MPKSALLTAIIALAQVFAAVGSVAATLTFAHLMGAVAFGQAMVLIALAGVVSLLVSLNIEGGAMRFMLQGGPEDRGRFRDASRWLVLGLGTLIGLLVWTIAGLLDLAPETALTLALLPGLIALGRVTARLGASLDAVRAATLPRLLARPLVLAVAAVMFWYFGTKPTVGSLVALVLAAAALTILVQSLLLTPVFAKMGPGRFRLQGVWLQTGLQLVPALLFLELFRDLVLISGAAGLSLSHQGVLAAALSLIALPGFALVASEIVFAPRISAAIAKGDDHARARNLQMAAMVRWLGGLGFGLALWLVAAPISRFLGPEFAAATTLLPILLIIPAARMIAGNPVLLMTVTGHGRAVAGICGIGAVGTSAAIVVSGDNLTAAAIAAAGGYTAVQLGLVLRCYTLTGIDSTWLWPRRRAAWPA